jgi:hypothetical protein
MDPRASGGVHITRDLLGMAARDRCGGRHVCLGERPSRKLVTDNLGNFGNRGDRHRLSTPSTPQDDATSTLSGAPALPCFKVIAVTEVIGYRRGHPCKWNWLDNLARSPLTPRFLLLVKLVISLDPLRSLYSLAPLVLVAIPSTIRWPRRC